MTIQTARTAISKVRSHRSFLRDNPSLLWFMGLLGLFTLGVTVLSEGFGLGIISTNLVKILGMTLCLCLCLIAVAMDVIWGYCGILSLGHFAFFGLGGRLCHRHVADVCTYRNQYPRQFGPGHDPAHGTGSVRGRGRADFRRGG